MFGEKTGDIVRAVSLLSLPASRIRTVYLVLFALIALFGAADIMLQNNANKRWRTYRDGISIGLTLLIASFAVLNRQPYVAFFALWLLVVKAVVYIKQR